MLGASVIPPCHNLALVFSYLCFRSPPASHLKLFFSGQPFGSRFFITSSVAAMPLYSSLSRGAPDVKCPLKCNLSTGSMFLSVPAEQILLFLSCLETSLSFYYGKSQVEDESVWCRNHKEFQSFSIWLAWHKLLKLCSPRE